MAFRICEAVCCVPRSSVRRIIGLAHPLQRWPNFTRVCLHGDHHRVCELAHWFYQEWCDILWWGSSIWLFPVSADQVIRVNISTGAVIGYKNWPTGFAPGGAPFQGGVFYGSSIWLVPYNADRIIRIGDMNRTCRTRSISATKSTSWGRTLTGSDSPTAQSPSTTGSIVSFSKSLSGTKHNLQGARRWTTASLTYSQMASDS